MTKALFDNDFTQHQDMIKNLVRLQYTVEQYSTESERGVRIHKKEWKR